MAVEREVVAVAEGVVVAMVVVRGAAERGAVKVGVARAAARVVMTVAVVMAEVVMVVVGLEAVRPIASGRGCLWRPAQRFQERCRQALARCS
jgi:hypothetical protein